jgi:uncharacterized RDD family membrane protein YckC
VLHSLPRLPDPNEQKSVVEKRCAGCGAWNHAAELRCQRCGRKLETLLGADGRRELEETETLPGPAIAAAATPKPSPQPEWKEELNRRLAGYRERQAEKAETAPSTRKEGERLPLKSIPIDKPSLPPPAPRGEHPSAPALRTGPTARRLPQPPIVDRLLHAQATLPRPLVRTPPEQLLAPIRFRFIAGLLDLCVVALALGVFVAVAHFTNPLILSGPDQLAVIGGAFVVLLVIYWVAYLRLMGSTAGMHWTGLRVVNFDGEPPDSQQRWTRALGTVLSAAALGVGFLWSLFDEQRYTWHDRVSKTFVSLNS